MKVLVTGGSGFIGSALVRHLLADNYEVRVLARHKHNRFLLEDLDVEIADGDIIYPESVEKAIKGCSVVFNLASIYTFYPFWDREAKALYKINVQGTINVLNAALKNKVERFIHTSTIATIGKRPDGKLSDEDTGFNFKGASHYARSKYLAEEEVWKFCRKGLPAIILNPGIVIGERDYKPTPSGEAIVKFLNRSYPAYFYTLWAVADVDDVAKAHIAALKQGRIGERYILCNKSHYTLKEIFGILEEISGIKAPRIKIPYPFLLAFVYLEELLSYRIFKKKPLMPTEGVKFCHMSIAYDNTKAVSELGYAATPIEETLKKAVYWYRMHGYIEPRGFLRLKANGSKKVKFIMQKLQMHKYTDRLSLGTLSFFFIVKFLQFLKKTGFKPKVDGWRKVTEAYLRTEESKYMLAVFRLNFWSDIKINNHKTLDSAKKHFIERLSQFPIEYPMPHWQLQWERFSTKRQKKKFIDIVHAEFNKDGCLQNLEPYLDSTCDEININNLDPELKIILLQGIIDSYNKTNGLPDKKRPLILKKELKRWVLRCPALIKNEIKKQAQCFIDRVLSAVFINFEVLPPTEFPMNERRLRCPSFLEHKHPGFGYLNIICRFTHDLIEADLWIQFSHIPVDGAPVQDVLTILKRCWGTCGEFKIPLFDNEKRVAPQLCSTEANKQKTYHLNQFIDFQPLRRFRKQLNKQYVNRAEGIITIAAVFIWKLAQHSAFEDIKFAIPVDLRPTISCRSKEKHLYSVKERTLGFIFIRPGIYFNKKKPDKGFLDFQQEFNRQLKTVRKRQSESYMLLENYTLVSPFMYFATLKLLPYALREFVGTVGVTIIKNADIFISPFSDVHTDGFIAIGNFLIPTEDGKLVGSVSIKGPKDRITGYLDAVKEVARG